MKKKTIALTLSLVLALAAIIGGSLAYFNYYSKTKVNTFTTAGTSTGGNTDDVIVVEEPGWDPDVDHSLTPGAEFTKDPRIINQGDLDLWAFLKMDIDNYYKLINLMLQEAYKANTNITLSNNQTCTLSGDYSLASFAQLISNYSNDDKRAVFQAIVNRWFKGINHEHWEIMNLEEVTNKLSAALTTIASGNDPTDTSTGGNPDNSKISLILGYKGPVYKETYTTNGTDSTWVADTNPSQDPEGKDITGYLPKTTLSSGSETHPVAGDIRYRTEPFMEAFTMPGAITKEMMYSDNNPDFLNYDKGETLDLSFTGYAIQHDNIGSLQAAYTTLGRDFFYGTDTTDTGTAE